jgi:adenine-specific DNA-methyltransferase
MSHLLRDFRGKIDLIYIDPPFDSKANYRRKISLRGIDTVGDRNSFEEIQYTDLWESGNYLQFVHDRCVLIKELIAPKGVFVFHCDQKKNYQIRQVVEEILLDGFETRLSGTTRTSLALAETYSITTTTRC